MDSRSRSPRTLWALLLALAPVAAIGQAWLPPQGSASYTLSYNDVLNLKHYLPDGKWPSGYGVPEEVPNGYLAQMKYPFVRKAG